MSAATTSGGLVRVESAVPRRCSCSPDLHTSVTGRPAVEGGAACWPLQHLAFMVRTRATVDELHEWAQGAGSEVIHRPREFPDYPPPYYATFWLDPFGLMLEAVCHYSA